MNGWHQLLERKNHVVIGLMSGTCTDGVDAALVKIKGYGIDTKVTLLNFLTIPYEEELRNLLLRIASGSYGGSYEISKANILLGHLFAEACAEVCKKGDIPIEKVDYIGSHGHTIYHQPQEEIYFGHRIHSTFQIGEAAIISERIKCPVISDFRVRDMAAGGLGAPLVPYTEYLLYSESGKNIALQNIGGIGNITYLPANGDRDKILAFDTGPGNMIMDALTAIYTSNRKTYDEGGKIAAKGKVQPELLAWLLQDKYIHNAPPKTTGREHYGEGFVSEILQQIAIRNISLEDCIATTTMFTAKSIESSVINHLPEMPECLIIGGGGSQNRTLLQFIKSCLSQCKVMTNEELGMNSNAKEAIAFAILANETIYGISNNIPSATGAQHKVVMGKLTQ